MNPILLALSLNEAALVLTALRGSEGAGANATLDGVIGDLQTLVHRAENPDLYADEDPRDDVDVDHVDRDDDVDSEGDGYPPDDDHQSAYDHF